MHQPRRRLEEGSLRGAGRRCLLRGQLEQSGILRPQPCQLSLNRCRNLRHEDTLPAPAAVFTAEGIGILPTPPRAPRANAICERIIGTLRREVFDRLLIINEHHLRQVLTEYLLHYNTARPHRSLGPSS